MKFYFKIIFLYVFGVFSSLIAQEVVKPTGVEPVLVPDIDLLAKIAALPDNTWMKLPPLKTAGDLSWCGKPGWSNTENMPKFGPDLRGYSLKMVWAADRKRAFYCGANHQAPHFLNDVWEYDLGSNTWVCSYTPDPQSPIPREWRESDRTPERVASVMSWIKKNVVLRDGIIQTERGGQVRPCHAWSGVTYDSDRLKFLWFVPKGQGCTFIDKETLAIGLGFQNESELKSKWHNGKIGRYTNNYIWSFDPSSKKWEIIYEDVPVFDEGQAAIYISDKKKVWTSLDAQMFDPDKKVTENPKASGKIAGVGEVVAAYDQVSKTIVMLSQNKTNVYSFATNEWKITQDNAIASGADMRSFFCFDNIAKKFVLYTIDKGPKGENKPGLYLYDLEKNEWLEANALGDIPTGCLGGYYDPERNVTVAYTGKEIYVYRCKAITR